MNLFSSLIIPSSNDSWEDGFDLFILRRKQRGYPVHTGGWLPKSSLHLVFSSINQESGLRLAWYVRLVGWVASERAG